MAKNYVLDQRLTVLISRAQRKELDRLCKKRRRSLGEVVREALFGGPGGEGSGEPAAREVHAGE